MLHNHGTRSGQTRPPVSTKRRKNYEKEQKDCSITDGGGNGGIFGRVRQQGNHSACGRVQDGGTENRSCEDGPGKTGRSEDVGWR